MAFKINAPRGEQDAGGGSAESHPGADRQVSDRQVSCRGRFILVMKSRSPRVNLFISEGEVSQEKVKQSRTLTFHTTRG